MVVEWGYNRAFFTKSDITFKGTDCSSNNYLFKFKKVKAYDRPTTDFTTYYHPLKFTIPQYNFNYATSLKNNTNISIGIDHMKYVVKSDQTVSITGDYENCEEFQELKNEQKSTIKLDKNKFELEHSDGLNYINTQLYKETTFLEHNNFRLNPYIGGGLGLLSPVTKSKLFCNDMVDKLNLTAGGGINITVGTKLLYKKFFTNIEVKVGYINMPNIRTTKNKKLEKASQYFFFVEPIVKIGVNGQDKINDQKIIK